VHPRAGVDNVEKRKALTLPELQLRPFGCPAGSHSLYGLDRGLLSLQMSVKQRRPQHALLLLLLLLLLFI
jgi:hypothetical protein